MVCSFSDRAFLYRFTEVSNVLSEILLSSRSRGFSRRTQFSDKVSEVDL